MKILLLLFTLILVGCNGSGGAGGSSEEFNGTTEAASLIQYDSLGTYATWNNSGTVYERSLGSSIYDSEITLPSYLTVTQDQNSSLRVGDTAYLMFNNYFENRCEYVYDGTRFNFNECKDDVAGFQVGDTIVLSNYPHPTFGVTKETVIMLYGRTSGDLHSGIIKMNGLL